MKKQLIDVPVSTSKQNQFRVLVNQFGGEIVNVVEFSGFLLFLISCDHPQRFLDAGFYSFVKSEKFQKYAEYS